MNTPELGAGVRLCRSDALAERGAGHVFEVLEYGNKVPAFAVRFEGRVVAYLNRCAHVPTTLDWQPGEFFDADRQWLICAVHGATYAPHSGHCVAGPCPRGRLTPLDVDEADGWVRWHPSRDIQPLQPSIS